MRGSLTVGVLMAAIGSGAQAISYGGHTPTAIEQARLPTYCYAQFVDTKYAGKPGYSLPPACGVYMNHLCPGYLNLMRAEAATATPNIKVQNARGAISNFKYTLNGMTPSCPLRPEVEAALIKAESILRLNSKLLR